LGIVSNLVRNSKPLASSFFLSSSMIKKIVSAGRSRKNSNWFLQSEGQGCPHDPPFIGEQHKRHLNSNMKY
jgi:hypothetical protein